MMQFIEWMYRPHKNYDLLLSAYGYVRVSKKNRPKRLFDGKRLKTTSSFWKQFESRSGAVGFVVRDDAGFLWACVPEIAGSKWIAIESTETHERLEKALKESKELEEAARRISMFLLKKDPTDADFASLAETAASLGYRGPE